MIKGTFGTSQKTRPNRTASHELIMLHSRLEVPNMFQSLGDLLLVVPFMLHGCKYKAMIRVYIYIYIYTEIYTNLHRIHRTLPNLGFASHGTLGACLRVSWQVIGLHTHSIETPWRNPARDISMFIHFSSVIWVGIGHLPQPVREYEACNRPSAPLRVKSQQTERQQLAFWAAGKLHVNVVVIRPSSS